MILRWPYLLAMKTDVSFFMVLCFKLAPYCTNNLRDRYACDEIALNSGVNLS